VGWAAVSLLVDTVAIPRNCVFVFTKFCPPPAKGARREWQRKSVKDSDSSSDGYGGAYFQVEKQPSSKILLKRRWAEFQLRLSEGIMKGKANNWEVTSSLASCETYLRVGSTQVQQAFTEVGDEGPA
jgi:hypothetical protein